MEATISNKNEKLESSQMSEEGNKAKGAISSAGVDTSSDLDIGTQRRHFPGKTSSNIFNYADYTGNDDNASKDGVDDSSSKDGVDDSSSKDGVDDSSSKNCCDAKE